MSQEPQPKYLNYLESGLDYLEYHDGKTDPSNYITPIYNVPSQVLIAYDDLYCSGSLIRSRIVVTAASCFVKMNEDSWIIVKVGSPTMTDLGQAIEVLEVKKHEYFGRATDLDNDIALLVLRDHVEFSRNVKKILLTVHVMQKQSEIHMSSKVTACGWGSSNLLQIYNSKLLCSNMKIIDKIECEQLYKMNSKSNFCVQYQSKYRLSDNGGPVIYKQKLVGIVSYGADRIERPYIALVTNVTRYLKWINMNVRRFLEKYCTPDSKPLEPLKYYNEYEYSGVLND